CPSGAICGDPGGFGGGINPAQVQGQAFGQMGFDPAAAGMVGAASPQAAQFISSPVICQIATRNILQCRPTFTLQQCHTQTPICWTTQAPLQCPTRSCTVLPPCQIPTLPGGCPSGPVCGGGGGFGGGGF